MEQRDIQLVSDEATADQINAIMSRSAAGNIGTVCVSGHIRDSIYDYHGNGRFKWLKQFFHTLRYGCD